MQQFSKPRVAVRAVEKDQLKAELAEMESMLEALRQIEVSLSQLRRSVTRVTDTGRHPGRMDQRGNFKRAGKQAG